MTTLRRQLQPREIRILQPAPQLGSLCVRVRLALQKGLVSFGPSVIGVLLLLLLQGMALGCIRLPGLARFAMCIGFGRNDGAFKGFQLDLYCKLQRWRSSPS